MTTTDWTKPPNGDWPTPTTVPTAPNGDWRAQPAEPTKPQGQQLMYVKAAGNGLAITGFVAGLFGFLCGFIPVIGFLGAFFWGVFGLIFAILGFRKAKRIPVSGHKGLAIAGIGLSIAAFGIGIANVAATSAAVNEVDKAITHAGQQWNSYSECMDHVDLGSSTFQQDMDACSELLSD